MKILKKNKQVILKKINMLQPIILVICIASGIFTLNSALSNINWVALGGTIRDWYWYEILIEIIWLVTSVLSLGIFLVRLILIKWIYKFSLLMSLAMLCSVWVHFGYSNMFAVLLEVLFIIFIIYTHRLERDSI